MFPKEFYHLSRISKHDSHSSSISGRILFPIRILSEACLLFKSNLFTELTCEHSVAISLMRLASRKD